MTHPLTPREKVKLKPSFGDVIENGWASDANPTRIGFFVREFTRTGRLNPGVTWEITDGKGKFWEFKPKDISEGGRLKVTRRTALASGSGDHAELISLLRWGQKDPLGDGGTYIVRNPDGRKAADVMEALLAENAALRASVVKANDGFEEYERRFYLEQERATEAERKLAEAVGLLREWMGTWFVDADSRGESAIADDTRKFLSKEAERG